MELAVNMPEQEPQVGQAERSISATVSSSTESSAAITMAVDQVELVFGQLVLPGFHGAAGDERRQGC